MGSAAVNALVVATWSSAIARAKTANKSAKRRALLDCMLVRLTCFKLLLLALLTVVVFVVVSASL